ncbi:MAG: PAS domain-containing protein, partial [Fidelibacterota bacterium]
MIGSEGACEIYGVEGGRFEYEYVKNIPLAEYRPLMDAALKNLMEKNEPYDIEFKIKATNTGEIKDIHSRAFYDRERNTLFGTIQDITDQKKAQNEIIELKEFNESLLRGMAEGLVVMDEEGKIEYVNPAGEAILGYPREKLLGRHY